MSTLNELLADQRLAVIIPKTDSCAEIRLTHRELRANFELISKQLALGGVKSGDVVSLFLTNGIEIVTAFVGVTLTGAAANPLNPNYTVDEVLFYLEDTRCKHMLVPADAKLSANARAAAAKVGAQVWVTEYNSKLNQVVISGNGVPSHSSSQVISAACPRPSPELTALILHTSGTTSRPKAVPLTHANLMCSTRNIANTYRLTPADRGLLVMPLFHVHGLLAGLLAPLYAGGSIVIQSPRFSAKGFWNDLLTYECSWYTAVPTMHQILLSQLAKAGPAASEKLKQDLARVGRLRFIRSCSSALAPATFRQLEDLLNVPVLEAYAMTEASHQMTSNNLPPLKRKAGSVGQGQGVEVAILTSEGKPVPQGSIGEVCVRGANVTHGYLRNPTANAESFFPGSWLRTGDQGYMDEEGFVYLTGRLKELINRGGEKIMPGEIDSALLEHPAVAEAVAFGVPDEMLGQAVNAAVVLKPGKSTSEDEIKSFLKTKLATFKVPAKIFITDSVPRTATGKIQRRFVAEHFLKENKLAAKL